MGRSFLVRWVMIGVLLAETVAVAAPLPFKRTPRAWERLGRLVERVAHHPVVASLERLWLRPINLAGYDWGTFQTPARVVPPLPSLTGGRPMLSAVPVDRPVRVMTANLFLLPWPFASDHFRRLESCARMVRELDPDILALQEVWFTPLADHLHRLLPDYTLVQPDVDGMFLPSGLLILTRIEPGKASWAEFPRHWGFNIEEWLARKGFLELRLPLPTGDDLIVVNTHLYSRKTGREAIFAPTFLASMFARFSPVSRPTLVVGDLNLDVETVSHLASTSFRLDSCREPTNTHGPSPRGRKIDYLLSGGFARVGGALPIVHSRAVSQPIVSDHKPVFGLWDLAP
jgi:endonuclease/exonuclease/phosphatase family metal-dependent hydrolase